MFGIKRTRDAFDVMLAICQARHPAKLADSIRQNCIQDRLESLSSLLTDVSLRSNIGMYWPGATEPDAWAAVAEIIEAFLDDAGIDSHE